MQEVIEPQQNQLEASQEEEENFEDAQNYSQVDCKPFNDFLGELTQLEASQEDFEDAKGYLQVDCKPFNDFLDEFTVFLGKSPRVQTEKFLTFYDDKDLIREAKDIIEESIESGKCSREDIDNFMISFNSILKDNNMVKWELRRLNRPHSKESYGAYVTETHVAEYCEECFTDVQERFDSKARQYIKLITDGSRQVSQNWSSAFTFYTRQTIGNSFYSQIRINAVDGGSLKSEDLYSKENKARANSMIENFLNEINEGLDHQNFRFVYDVQQEVCSCIATRLDGQEISSHSAGHGCQE